MHYENVLKRLNEFKIEGDWPSTIFLLPESALDEIYEFISINDSSVKSRT
jgi:hypothetical protein